MRKLCSVLATLLVLSLVVPALAQQVNVTVEPQRAQDDSLTGNYVAKVMVTGAATARQVVFRLNFPKEYTVDMTASDIQIVAVVPGDDAMMIDADETPDGVAETPVVFAEAVAGDPTNGIWIVALMKDDAQKDPKHVCDIVFTSRGRATTAPVAFEAGSVTVKDGTLAVLTDQGAFSTAQVPLFGDFNWDNAIDPNDLFLFAQAWREYYATSPSPSKALADIAPRATDPTVVDPAAMLSTGDDTVDPNDLFDFALAWREYYKAQSTAAPQVAPKGESN